jgi:ribose 5-phosphate isomerase RpiB
MLRIADTFLDAGFDGGRHAVRVAMLDNAEG